MGEIVRAFILGVVQGVAEFLPISSSGHLVIAQEILGGHGFDLAFDVLLHVGTLVAVIVYFWRDYLEMALGVLGRGEDVARQRRLVGLLIVATGVTGAIGLAGNDFFESLFESPAWVGVFLLVTATFLTIAERLSSKAGHDAASMSWVRAALIGAAQGMAIAPGISRSGATIAGGLGVGLDREQAARFSFLLSGPIILLAAAKTAFDLVQTPEPLPGAVALVVGFVTAAVTGYAAIAGLLAYLRKRSLYVFALYTAAAGVAVIVWQAL